MISSVLALSRFPVGSSAMMIPGFFTIALAIATLCRWPPESRPARLFLYWSMPTFSRQYLTRAVTVAASLIPIMRSARATFSNTVLSSIRLKFWKIYPIFAFLMLSIVPEEDLVMFSPSIVMVPLSMLSRPPMAFSNVVLPQPEGPRMQKIPLSGSVIEVLSMTWI